jgi:hypothetical protein
MRQYRIYTLDDAGKFIGAREIDAAGDADAIDAVKLLPDDVGFEIWRGPRMVGHVGRDKIALLAQPPDPVSRNAVS